MFVSSFRTKAAAVNSPTPVFGLIFPSNGVAGGDIRLLWTGANLLPRTAHTAIWKTNFVQQTGYYAVTWHSQNTGTFAASPFEYGAHPYPSTGTVDATGQATGVTGATGTVHQHEIAGLGAHDYLASPGGSSVNVTKGIWYTQARTAELILGGTMIRHTFWPDILNNSGFSIVQDITNTGFPAPGANAAFYFGASDWTPVGSSNDECPSGTLRSFKLFNAALTLADITTEAAVESNVAQTSAGAASVWYMNVSPKPDDITDKSSAGHTPTWANANRPTLYTG